MGQAAGTLALTLGGRLIGGALGGPIGAAVGGMAGGLIGSLLFSRSQKPLIPDYQLASSSYGHPIPIIYGSVRLPATVIWEDQIVVHNDGVGKGLGGPSSASYWQDAAFAFCEAPAILLKIWLDGNLFYDNTALNPQELTKYTFAIREYNGGEDQLPDPLMQQWVFNNVLPGNSCPAYRGLCYLVFQQIDLAHFGNRMPNVTAVWSNNAVESVVLTEMIFAPGDTLTRTMSGIAGNAGAVDFLRFQCYSLTQDGVVRAWDMRSGANLATRTWDQLFSPVPPPDNPDAYAITCVPGSFVYVTNVPSGGGLSWNPQLIICIDPGNLNVISTTNIPGAPGADWVEWMTGFALTTVTGSFDMICGYFVLGGPFISDARFGYSILLASDVAYTGFFGNFTWVVGMQDPVNGLTELWLLNDNKLGPQTKLYKATVAGNDPSDIVNAGLFVEVATFTPADFGSSSTNSPSTAAIYDATDDTLIISNNSWGATIKWSGGGIVWVRQEILLNPNAPHGFSFDTAAGRFGDGFTGGSRDIWVADPLTGDDQSVYSSSDIPGSLSAQMTYGYSSGNNALLFSPNAQTLYIAYLQRQTGAEYPVADILTDLCERVGLTSDMFDVSLVTSTTWGYLVNDQKSAGQAIADLCHVYQIDMVESDYKLKFIPRGQASVATIPQDDLASTDTNDQGKFWEAKRAQVQELPLQVNVRHNDPELDYQANAAFSKRIAAPVPTQFSKRVKTIDLPVVATSAEARHIAEQWLYTLWAERDTYKTRVGWKYMWLDPTDNVTVDLDSGDTFTVRVESTDLGTDYTIDLNLASEDATTYAISTSPGALVGFKPQVLKPAAFVNLLQWNTPLLQDVDDLGGTQSRIYYAGGPSAAAATSLTATLYQSPDASVWTNFAPVNQMANWGRAVTALPDVVSKFATDFVNVVRVTLSPSSVAPVSCTYADMMNGVNAALLGGEIIQFQNVTTNGDGTISLSPLLRGRRGTEYATGTHSPGEPFVLLQPGQIQANRLPLSDIGVAEFYKLVPINSFLDSTPTQGFKYLGYDLMPYAPVNLERAPSGGDLVLTWLRRTRIGGLLVDGSDTAPLSEATELYEVYTLPNAGAIATFDPTNATTYTRKFTDPTSPTVTYTSTEMTADSFTPATDTLYLAVFQISAVVGRGFIGYAALPPF